MSTASGTDGQAIQVLNILRQQGFTHDDYEKIISGGHLAALAQVVKRGKLEDLKTFKKGINHNILTSVTPQPIAYTGGERFDIDDHFGENARIGKIRISVDRNWDAWFGGMVIKKSKSCGIEMGELTELPRSEPIAKEIGDKFCDTDAAILYWLIANGYCKKDPAHHIRGYIFFMKDKMNIRRSVFLYGSYYHDITIIKWQIRSFEMEHPKPWDSYGDVVVYRAPPIIA